VARGQRTRNSEGGAGGNRKTGQGARGGAGVGDARGTVRSAGRWRQETRTETADGRWRRERGRTLAGARQRWRAGGRARNAQHAMTPYDNTASII
jgi:hypothetical protein